MSTHCLDVTGVTLVPQCALVPVPAVPVNDRASVNSPDSALAEDLRSVDNHKQSQLETKNLQPIGTSPCTIRPQHGASYPDRISPNRRSPLPAAPAPAPPTVQSAWSPSEFPRSCQREDSPEWTPDVLLRQHHDEITLLYRQADLEKASGASLRRELIVFMSRVRELEAEQAVWEREWAEVCQGTW